VEPIIAALYELAERPEVELSDLAGALGVVVMDDGLAQSDSVADLAALMEESTSSQG
jgi:hypothetical protein